MTVTDVVRNFRSALTTVIPFFEVINLPWRAPEAYDEWDNVAEALFSALVVRALSWSLPSTSREEFVLPAYDLLAEGCENCSLIEVEHASLPPGRHVFHAFSTNKVPLDLVVVRRVADSGHAVDHTLVAVPVEGAMFLLRLAPSLGGGTIREVTIEA